MQFKIESLLDKIGVRILGVLQKDARASFSDIGRKVGLSSPAVAERIRKLEDAGIILGYHTKIDPQKTGKAIAAFIHLTAPPERYAKIKSLANSAPEILECHHVSGSESFIMKACVRSVSHLERLVEKLSSYGQTKTSIVLSSPVEKDVIEL